MSVKEQKLSDTHLLEAEEPTLELCIESGKGRELLDKPVLLANNFAYAYIKEEAVDEGN